MINASIIDNPMAQEFEDFHDKNPQVYAVLARLAREWVEATGRGKLGIKALYERARWEIAVQTSNPDYKLNNNFTAFYARLIMAQEQDLSEIFHMRGSAADDWILAKLDVMGL